MRILGKDLIEQFQLRHLQSRSSLDDWIKAIESGSWQHFAELRQSFRSVDYVKGHLIFDIKGNDFRLITVAIFQIQEIVIVNVFTHSEYDCWCRTIFKGKRKR